MTSSVQLRSMRSTRSFILPSKWSVPVFLGALLAAALLLVSLGGSSGGPLQLLLPTHALPLTTTPIVWGMTTTGAAFTTAGGSRNITLTGANFLVPGCFDPTLATAKVYWDNTQDGYGYATNPLLNVTVVNSATLIAGPIPPGTGAPRITVSTCNQQSLPLPRFPADVLFWEGGGVPMAAAACVKAYATGYTESSAWIENYLCTDDQRALAIETVGGTTNLVPIFRWYTQATAPTGYRCVEVTSTAPSWSASKKWICVPPESPYYLTWSKAGAIPGLLCKPFIVVNDPYWSKPDHQLCASPAPSAYPTAVTTGTRFGLQYTYAAPVLTSPSGTINGPVDSGMQLTLLGSSFGFANVTQIIFTMSINGNLVLQTCNIDAARHNHTYSVCNVPAGPGLNVPFKMSVSGQTSTVVYFNYDPPVVTSLSPPTVGTDGTALLNLIGYNFGASQGQGLVYVNGLPCNVLSWTDKVVSCYPTVGGTLRALNIPISIRTISGTYPTAGNALTTNYTAPFISSITPATINTLGGEMLTINGTNFGLEGSVAVNGLNCLLSGSAWGQSTVQCISPVGQGTNVAVLLRVGLVLSDSQLSNRASINYSAPAMATLSPTSRYIAERITITGSNFGSGPNTTVTIGGVPCAIPDVGGFSLTRIICVVPSGSGLQLPVQVFVLGRGSNTMLFNYLPSISNVTSSSPLRFPAANPGDAIVLNVTGANFGFPNQATSQVRIGAQNCTTLVQTPTWISCILPNGTGTALNLQVWTLGYSSLPWSFSYNVPILSNMSSLSGPAAGGQLLTLSGSNFGAPANLNYYAPVVAIGASLCTVVLPHTDSRIVCRVAGGSGRLQAVTVTVGSETSTPPLYYSFDAPILYTLNPSNGPSQGGYSVTLTGVNFATPAATSVLAGGSIVTSAFQNDTYLVFTMPSGSGTVTVSLVVNQQPSNGLVFNYDPPVISSIVPGTGPTAGGTVVALNGNGFGLSGTVQFAGVELPASSILSYTPSVVTFRTPAGEGANQTVAIVSLGRLSSGVLFNYIQPNVSSVTPRNGPPSGGTLITLTGTNFGRSGVVSINGAVCSTAAGGSWADSLIVCSTPAGMGFNLPMTISVVGE